MLPLLLALASVQPAITVDRHAALLAQSDAIDSSFTAERAKHLQAAYLALAERARELGDRAVANALAAKAAYMLSIQGRNDEARLSLIALSRDADSTVATQSFATQLLSYINRPSDDPLADSTAAIGGYHMTTHSPVGLSLSRPR